jgi:hypothetical protein
MTFRRDAKRIEATTAREKENEVVKPGFEFQIS